MTRMVSNCGGMKNDMLKPAIKYPAKKTTKQSGTKKKTKGSK